MSRSKGKFISLRIKTIVLAVIVCLIGIIVSTYYVSVKAEGLLYSYKLERMDSLGRTFASNAEHGVLLKSRTIANKICYSVTQEPDVLFAILFDSERNIFAGNYVGLPQKYFSFIKNLVDTKCRTFPGDAIIVAKDQYEGSEVMVQPIFSSNLKDISRFGQIDDSGDAGEEIIGYSVIVFTLKNIRNEIHRVRMFIAGISLVALILIVVFFYLLADIPIRNLRYLLEAIKRLGRGDLNARVNFKSRDEVGELGLGFNKMAEDLNRITVSRDILVKETAARERAQNALLRKSMQYEKQLEEEVQLKTKELKDALTQNRKASLETIYRLSLAAEYRDRETGNHLLRMSHYSAAIAGKIGLGDKYVEAILYASLMHDVGKIGISDTILLKPGKLDPEEWDVMKRHTLIGAQILEDSEAEFIKLAQSIALTHHEKWDGTGYPRGLKGEEIDLAGRITAIADVFDAVTSERPYKSAYSVKEAFEIIRSGKGIHFDPDLVDAFFEIKDEILDIRNKDGLVGVHNNVII